jgi:hypothetical protein
VNSGDRTIIAPLGRPPEARSGGFLRLVAGSSTSLISIDTVGQRCGIDRAERDGGDGDQTVAVSA